MNWKFHFLDYRLLLVRGVLSLIFGVLALTWPAPTLLTVALLYGAYCFVDGAAAIASGIRRSRLHESWGLPMLEGGLGIAAGVVTFLWPGITLLVLSLLVGVWAIATGVLELFAAFHRPASPFRESFTTTGRVLLGLGGLFSLLLGLAIFVAPALGAITLLLFVAVYSLAFGAVMIALGLRLKKDRSFHDSAFPNAA